MTTTAGRALLEERFWSKVDLDGATADDDCYNWTGALDRQGYGQFWLGDRSGLAHRVAYELARGPIPDGLTLDHLCRNRKCVRPDHLEPVTIKENTLRGTSPSALHAVKTHCHRGHEFTPENTFLKANGKGRECRECRRAYFGARPSLSSRIERARREAYEQAKADAIAAVETMSDFTYSLPGLVERADIVLALRDLKP
jgi:hypothetical protein